MVCLPINDASIMPPDNQGISKKDKVSQDELQTVAKELQANRAAVKSLWKSTDVQDRLDILNMSIKRSPNDFEDIRPWKDAGWLYSQSKTSHESRPVREILEIVNFVEAKHPEIIWTKTGKSELLDEKWRTFSALAYLRLVTVAEKFEEPETACRRCLKSGMAGLCRKRLKDLAP